MIRKDNIRFIAVFGENVRRYRHQIKTLPGVKFAFPIGLRLNVWLDATQSMQDFQQALRSLSGDFTAKTQQPSLHDATLYDLAKAEQDDDHAGV